MDYDLRISLIGIMDGLRLMSRNANVFFLAWMILPHCPQYALCLALVSPLLQRDGDPSLVLVSRITLVVVYHLLLHLCERI